MSGWVRSGGRLGFVGFIRSGGPFAGLGSRPAFATAALAAVTLTDAVVSAVSGGADAGRVDQLGEDSRGSCPGFTASEAPNPSAGGRLKAASSSSGGMSSSVGM